MPSFALERAQEILYYASELVHANTIPDITVYVDSPMTRRITEVFKRHIELYDKDMAELIRKHQSPFFFPGLKIVETVEESKAINFDTGSSMIIAGSGMITGGRIKHHLAANIDRPDSTLLFVGYQASGTLGRYIASGADTVRLFGQEHKVRCQVKQIQGFSAHADRDGLLRWLSAFKQAPRRLFVTHGESDAAASFAAYVKEKLGWETAVPQYLDNVPLD